MYPANRVWPSALHAKLTHSGSRLFLPEPVAVGGEYEGVDFVAGSQAVEMLGLVQIPKHGSAILATAGTERAVRRDGDRVDVAGVTNVVGLDAAGSEFPDLLRTLRLASGS